MLALRHADDRPGRLVTRRRIRRPGARLRLGLVLKAALTRIVVARASRCRLTACRECLLAVTPLALLGLGYLTPDSLGDLKDALLVRGDYTSARSLAMVAERVSSSRSIAMIASRGIPE